MSSDETVLTETTTMNYPWQAIIDPATQQVYYYNVLTEVTQWELPEDYADESQTFTEEDRDPNVQPVEVSIGNSGHEEVISSVIPEADFAVVEETKDSAAPCAEAVGEQSSTLDQEKGRLIEEFHVYKSKMEKESEQIMQSINDLTVSQPASDDKGGNDSTDAELILLRRNLSDVEASLQESQSELNSALQMLDEERQKRVALHDELEKEVEKLRQAEKKLSSSEEALGNSETESGFQEMSLALSAAQYLYSKAESEINRGNFLDASILLKECYSIRKIHMYGSALTADTCQALSENLVRTGELPEAIKYNQETQEYQKLLYGDLAEQTCASVHTDATIKCAMGELTESEALFTSNKATRIEVNGDVGAALHGLGEIQLKLGKYTDASDNAEKGYNYRMRVHKGLKHLSVLESLILKAKICNAKGDYDGGSTLGEQALANIRFITESESNPMVAQALFTIGESQYGLGTFVKALETFEKAATMAIKYLGENHYTITMYLLCNMKTQIQLGKFSDLRKTLESLTEIKSRSAARDDFLPSMRAEIAYGCALYHKAVGSFNEANVFFSEALEHYNVMYKGTGPVTLQFKIHPVIAEVLLEQGDNFRRLGHYENAQHYIECAKTIIGDTVGREHPLYGIYLQYAGDLFTNIAAKTCKKEDFEVADKQLKRCLNLRRSILCEHHYDLSVTLNSIGELCRLQEDFDDAERYFEEALQIRCNNPSDSIGPEHWTVFEVQSNQALLLAAKNAYDCQSDDFFTSNPMAPMPAFNYEGFLEASVMLHKVILKLGMKFHMPDVHKEHPILINVRGNFGLVKKIESIEKMKFANKLNKTHRKLFKEQEGSRMSASPSEGAMYDDIGYKDDARAFIQATIRNLKSAGIHEEHFWVKKFESYDIEESSSDELDLAERIMGEGKGFTDKGMYRNAEDRYEVALDTMNNVLGADNIVHPLFNTLVLFMADNCLYQARFREARVMYEKCLSMSLKLYEHDSLEVGKAYIGMGNLFLSVSRYTDAKGYFERALECCINAKRSEIDNESIIIAKIALIECKFYDGRYFDAFEMMKDFKPYNKISVSENIIVRALLIEARILHALNRMHESLKLLDEAESYFKKRDVLEDHPTVAKIKMYMALCNFDLNNFELSMIQIQNAAQMASKYYGIKNDTSSSKNMDEILHLTEDDLQSNDSVQSVFHEAKNSEHLSRNESDEVKGETSVEIHDIENDLSCQEDGVGPYYNDYVFTVNCQENLKEVYKYGGMETKSHPFLAELALMKARFLMKLMIHETKTINIIIDAASMMQKSIFGGRSLEFANAQFCLACFEFYRGNWDESLELFEVVNHAFASLYAESHPIQSEAMYWIAEIKAMYSCYFDALEIHRNVLSSRRTIFGENHPKCIDSINSIINCLMLSGRLKDAEEMIDVAKTTLRDTFSEDASHPSISQSFLIFGQALKDKGQYNQAIAYVERSLTMYVSLYGDSDRWVATCLFHLAEILSLQGKFLESKERNEQCMRIRETKLPATHCDLAQSLYALGVNYSDLGSYHRSVLLFKMSMKIFKRAFRSNYKRNILVTNVIDGFGALFLRMGHYHYAKKLHEKSLKSYSALLDRNHPTLLYARFNLSTALMKEGRIDKALAEHEEILDIRKDTIGHVHKDLASSLHVIGVCMIHKGEYLEARSHIERSLNIRKKLLGMEHPDVAESLQSLGMLCSQQGKLVEAMVYYERALNNRRVSLGSQHPLVAETLCSMARLHNEQKNISIAYDMLMDSLKLRSVVFGEENIITYECFFEIANNLMVSGLYHGKGSSKVGSSELLPFEADDGSQVENGDNKFEYPMQQEFLEVEEIYESDVHSIDYKDVQVLRVDALFDGSKEKGIFSSANNGGTDSGVGSDYPKAERSNSSNLESIEKSSFISAHHLYGRVHKLRLNWHHSEHPSVVEIKHAVSVNDRLAGNIKDCHKNACSLLMLRRRVHGDNHPFVILSFLDVATCLCAMHKIEEPNNNDENHKIAEISAMKAKDGRQKVGVALVDQLKSSFHTNFLNEHDVWVKNGILHDRWASSASETLSHDETLPDLLPRKKKLNKWAGYMGYAYAEKKLLYDKQDVPKFGKVKVDSVSWLLDAAENLYYEKFGESEESPLLASILFERGLLLIRRRDLAAARKTLENCVNMRRRVLRNGHPSIADGLHAIAESYRVANEIKSAEPLYETSLEIKLKEYGPNHPSVADTLHNFAMLHFVKGSYATCKVYYNKALEIREEFLGSEHPAVAQTLNNLAGVLQLEGDFVEAERMYRRVISIRQRTLGDHHPDCASSLNNLGLLLKSRGKYSDAKTLYNQALKIQESSYGLLHPDIAATLNNLATLTFSEGNWTDSKAFYTRSIDMKQKVFGIDHPSVAVAQNNLAGLLYSNGELDEAIALFRESLRIRKCIYGDFHPLVAESMNNLSVALLSNGETEESNMHYERSLEIMTQCYGDDHPTVTNAKQRRLEGLRSNGQADDASSVCRTPSSPKLPAIL